MSEILPVKGVKLVYVAAALPASANRAAMEEFISHLRSPQARERLARAGFTAPE